MKLCTDMIAAFTVVVAWASTQVTAQSVFCHYLVGTIDGSTNHAQLDIQNAMTAGFDAFALNIGAPGESFTADTVAQLFNNAAGTTFGLFFSLDLSAHSSLGDFTAIVNQYLEHPNYHKGPDGNPFLSTFDSGGNSPAAVSSFLSGLATQVYFVPDFDDAPGYYTDETDFFSAWSSVLDGVFSWETAWPSTMDQPANTSTASDINVQSAASNNQKTYMIGLSSLQYKHLQGANYYRIGEVNLPQRMEEILAMNPPPDFVEVITWNDSGESHYIGNIWPEGSPPNQLAYANGTSWDHSGWRPLVSSFISAYKNKVSSAGMAPAEGEAITGAMWYRTLPVNAACSDDPYGKPDGWQAALDAVNLAIVLPSGASGYSAVVTSGSTQLPAVNLSPGLNYFSLPGLQVGSQSAAIYASGSSTPSYTATGNIQVYPDDEASPKICNFNYQVAGFASA